MSLHNHRKRLAKIRSLHSSLLRAERQRIPREIKIEVTGACNMDCPFCYNANTFGRSKTNLAFGQVERVIDEMTELGIPVVRFTGGEPTLHPELGKMVAYAREQKLYVKVNTNATAGIPSGADEVLVSFHALDDMRTKQEVVDALRNQGAIVVFNTVLTKDTIPHMGEFLDVAHDLGCPHFFAFPVPTKHDPRPVDHDDIKQAIDWLWKHREKGAHLAQAIPFCSYEPERIAALNDGVHCGMHENLVIDPSGNIRMCYSLPDPLGKVGEMKIIDAWNQATVAGVRSFTLLPSVCRQCRYVRRCLGGCRFAAHLASGDMLAMDPLARPELYQGRL